MTTDEIQRQIARLAHELDIRRRNVVTADGYRKAGVLVPLITESREFSLLFTRRTDTVETHKGQISFPGGMVDADDENIVHTALRELHEEIGIPQKMVHVLGLLDDLPTPTGFIITPVVGVLEFLPALRINTDEVAEVFEVPLQFFANPKNTRMEKREINGRSHEIWFFDKGKHNIWGATAMIVRSLLQVLHTV